MSTWLSRRRFSTRSSGAAFLLKGAPEVIRFRSENAVYDPSFDARYNKFGNLQGTLGHLWWVIDGNGILQGDQGCWGLDQPGGIRRLLRELHAQTSPMIWGRFDSLPPRPSNVQFAWTMWRSLYDVRRYGLKMGDLYVFPEMYVGYGMELDTSDEAIDRLMSMEPNIAVAAVIGQFDRVRERGLEDDWLTDLHGVAMRLSELSDRDVSLANFSPFEEGSEFVTDVRILLSALRGAHFPDSAEYAVSVIRLRLINLVQSMASRFFHSIPEYGTLDSVGRNFVVRCAREPGTISRYRNVVRRGDR